MRLWSWSLPPEARWIGSPAHCCRPLKQDEMTCQKRMAANTECTGQVGLVAIFEQFSGFKFVLLPSRAHARPPTSNANRWAVYDL